MWCYVFKQLSKQIWTLNIPYNLSTIFLVIELEMTIFLSLFSFFTCFLLFALFLVLAHFFLPYFFFCFFLFNLLFPLFPSCSIHHSSFFDIHSWPCHLSFNSLAISHVIPFLPFSFCVFLSLSNPLLSNTLSVLLFLNPYFSLYPFTVYLSAFLSVLHLYPLSFYNLWPLLKGDKIEVFGLLDFTFMTLYNEFKNMKK